MISGEKSAAVSEVYSFSDIVEDACEKLMDRQIKHSIRRIQKMDEQLCILEKELDDFLFHFDKKDRQ